MTEGPLTEVSPPPSWTWRPLFAVAPRIKEVGQGAAQPLSVFLDVGVVPRSSREDNHNRLGGDLDAYLVVRPGDLVFNKLRTWQGGFGVSDHYGIVSPAYFVCRPQERVVPRFLHHLLRSRPYLAELTRLSKWQPPSQFDIPWDNLRRLEILLPPAAEQRRIADFLDAEAARADRLLLLLDAVKAQVHERRLGQVYDLVTGATQGVQAVSSLPWAEVLPSHWPVVKLTYLAQLGSGHTPSRSHPEWWTDCYIPWITTGEVHQVRDDRLEVLTDTRETISDLGLANSSATLCPAGTVVLCRTASAGYSAVMGCDMAGPTPL